MPAFLLYFLDLKDLGLLVLRLAVGVVFWRHGMSKAKHATGKFKLLGVAEALASLSLFSGLLVQLAAIGLSIVMSSALYMKIAKWKVPFIGENTTGYELDLILLAANLALLTLGAGGISLDALIFGGY